MNKSSKTVVGTGIILIIAFLNQEGIGMLIFLLVVCTFGIGLIPLLGAGYLVGCLVDGIIHQAKGGKTSLAFGATAMNDSVVSYVKEARERGIKDEDIRSRLESKGWNDDLIDKALKAK